MIRLFHSAARWSLQNRQLLTLAVLFLFVGASTMHAQSTSSSSQFFTTILSWVTNLWASAKPLLLFLVGAIGAGCFVWGVIKALSQDWGGAMFAFGAALTAALIVAYGVNLISSVSGQQL